MSDESLLPRVREATHALLAGYLPPLRAAVDVNRFIQSPALAGDSALAGVVQMALDSLQEKETLS
jgi:hypothetical protein